MKKAMLALLFVVILSSFTKIPRGGNVTTINFTVNPADWIPTGKSGTPGCYMAYRYKTDTLTKSTFDNGMVMVYVLGTSGGGWYALPHSYYSSKVEVSTNFNYQTGYVELRTYAVNNQLAPQDISMRYKLVINQ